MLSNLLVFKVVLSCLSVFPSQSDSTFVRVEIKMAEEGFMCPFLTPMFLEILEDKGAEWVVCRPQESEVEFCTGVFKSKSKEVYTDWLTQLGYAEAQIQFAVFDTLATLPPLPTP
jgi:hypothetical protein